MEEQRVVNEEPLVVKVSDAPAPQEMVQRAEGVIEENRHGAATNAIENLILNEVAAAAAPETGAEQERRPEGIEVLAEALRASESAEAEQQIAAEENREENVPQPDGTEKKAEDVDQSPTASF